MKKKGEGVNINIRRGRIKERDRNDFERFVEMMSRFMMCGK